MKAAEKQLKGKKVESLESSTPEGITLKPLYSAADLERCEAVADAEHDAPGLFPYHRCAAAVAVFVGILSASSVSCKFPH